MESFDCSKHLTNESFHEKVCFCSLCDPRMSRYPSRGQQTISAVKSAELSKVNPVLAYVLKEKKKVEMDNLFIQHLLQPISYNMNNKIIEIWSL